MFSIEGVNLTPAINMFIILNYSRYVCAFATKIDIERKNVYYKVLSL